MVIRDPSRYGSLHFVVEPTPEPSEYAVSWFKHNEEKPLLTEKFTNYDDADVFYDFLRTLIDLKDNMILFKNIY